MNALKNKFLLTLALCSTFLHGRTQQADSMKLYEFQEVVISASRNEQQLLESGRAVIVISKEKIQSAMPQSIGQILEKEAGIYLTGTGQNFGSSQRMYIRGANSYHVLVMVDGVRISDPSSVDNGPDLSELSLDDIERIEIVKGSHSPYFGSSAIGGVVNIITSGNHKNGFSKSVHLGGGTFGKNTFLLNNSLNMKYLHQKGFYVGGSVASQLTHGLDATIDTVTDPLAFKNRDQDDYQLSSYSLKSGFRNEKIHVFVSWRNTWQESDLDKGAYRDDDNRFISFHRNLFSWGADYRTGKAFKFNYSGAYSFMQRIDTDDSSVVDALGNFDHSYSRSIFDGSYLMHDLTVSFTKNDYQIMAGVFSQSEFMNNRNYVFYWSPYFGKYEQDYNLDTLDIHSSTKGAFIHLSVDGRKFLSCLQGFKLESAGRMSIHSQFGQVFTWSLNPSYRLNKNSLLFASVTSGFNAPSLYRLYSPDMGWGAVVSRGNKNLKPERSLSFEAGIKSEFSENAFFEVTLYQTLVHDVIEYVYLWDKNIPLDSLGTDWMRNDYRGDTYINLSRMKLNGFEMKLSFSLTEKSRLTGFFSLMNGISPLSASDIDTSLTHGNHVQLFESGIFIGSRNVEKIGLIRRPDATAGFSLDYYPNKKLSFYVFSRMVGHRYDSYYNPVLGPYGALDNELIKGYFLADAGIKFQLFENLFLRLKVENLLNTKYMEINGFSTRPRGIYFSVNWE